MKTFSDYETGMKARLEHAKIREGVKGSEMFLLLWTENMDHDMEPMRQVGLAIAFDKPILVVALKGVPVPASLRKIAYAIEEIGGANEMQDATIRLINRWKAENGQEPAKPT